MADRVQMRYRVQRDINDYSVVAVPPDRAPYTVAGYILSRQTARLYACAPDLQRTASALLRAFGGDVPAWLQGDVDALQAVLARIEGGR